jgi:hypothetical protein
MVNMVDMSVGMLIGMILSPVMMKATKKLYHQYRAIPEKKKSVPIKAGCP